MIIQAVCLKFVYYYKGTCFHLNKRIFMLCVKFYWISTWLKFAYSKGFQNLVNVLSLSPYHLLSEKGMALHFNKFESSSPMDALCQVWMKLAWLLEIYKCTFSFFPPIYTTRSLEQLLILENVLCLSRKQITNP